MNAAARRNAHRRGWPRGLYEPRPGYYVWRNPSNGQTLPIGRVPLAVAKSEANAANLHVEGLRPTLLERVTSEDKTVSDLIDAMPKADKENTAKTNRTLDKRIKEALGGMRCDALGVRHCAELVDSIRAEGKHRAAQSIRSRLIALCKKGQAKGWIDGNPAEVTEAFTVNVKRGRLTLDTYRTIRARADEVNDWLGHAMDLALVTGADRSTLSFLTRKQIEGDALIIQRQKTKDITGLTIAIPLDLELAAAGLKLRDLVKHRTGIVSSFLIHHGQNYGNAPKGSRVHVNNFSRSFATARDLAGVTGNTSKPPTFHEIRSLAKRLYKAQGNVDHLLLLGHSDKKTGDKYADPRGAEAVRVSVKPLAANESEVNNQ